MATLTETRTAIMNALQAALGITFVGDKVDPPVERGDRGCVFIPRVGEMPQKVWHEQMTIVARAMTSTRRGRGARGTRDPASLEQWADQIRTALAAVQTQAGPDFIRVTEVRLDHDLGMVEATIVGWQPNVFTVV